MSSEPKCFMVLLTSGGFCSINADSIEEARREFAKFRRADLESVREIKLSELAEEIAKLLDKNKRPPKQ